MSSQALIDKIIKTAEAEAEQITDEILRRAADNEKTMLEKASAEVARINKESDEKCAQVKRISELTSGLEARKARLHARRTVLEEAFSEAYGMMLSLPDEKRLEYIKMLIVLFSLLLIAGGVVILINPWWNDTMKLFDAIGVMLLFSALIGIVRLIIIWPIKDEKEG